MHNPLNSKSKKVTENTVAISLAARLTFDQLSCEFENIGGGATPPPYPSIRISLLVPSVRGFDNGNFSWCQPQFAQNEDFSQTTSTSTNGLLQICRQAKCMGGLAPKHPYGYASVFSLITTTFHYTPESCSISPSLAQSPHHFIFSAKRYFSHSCNICH